MQIKKTKFPIKIIKFRLNRILCFNYKACIFYTYLLCFIFYFPSVFFMDGMLNFIHIPYFGVFILLARNYPKSSRMFIYLVIFVILKISRQRMDVLSFYKLFT